MNHYQLRFVYAFVLFSACCYLGYVYGLRPIIKEKQERYQILQTLKSKYVISKTQSNFYPIRLQKVMPNHFKLINFLIQTSRDFAIHIKSLKFKNNHALYLHQTFHVQAEADPKDFLGFIGAINQHKNLTGFINMTSVRFENKNFRYEFNLDFFPLEKKFNFFSKKQIDCLSQDDILTFSIKDFKYKAFIKTNTIISALILLPNHDLKTIYLGSYIGKEHAKVNHLAPGRIELILKSHQKYVIN